MVDFKDATKALGRPMWRIVLAAALLVFPGLAGWLLIPWPENVEWLRIPFEIGALASYSWGIKDLKIYRNKRKSKIKKSAIDKRRKGIRGLLYITGLLITAGSLWFTVVDLGIRLPQLPTFDGQVSTSTPVVTQEGIPVTDILQNSGTMDIVDFVAAFFDAINNAGNESDLIPVLEHFGNLRHGNAFWWSIQVRYDIYRCNEPKTIYVGLTYFNRGNNFTAANRDKPEISEFTLDVVGDEWIFQTSDPDVGSVSSSCELAASNWPNK